MLLIIIDFFTDSRKLRMHIECVTVTLYVTHAHLSQPIQCITTLSTFTAKGLMDVKSRPMAFMKFEYV